MQDVRDARAGWQLQAVAGRGGRSGLLAATAAEHAEFASGRDGDNGAAVGRQERVHGGVAAAAQAPRLLHLARHSRNEAELAAGTQSQNCKVH